MTMRLLTLVLFALTTFRAVSGQTYTISTIAGNGTAGFSGDNGPAASAQLNAPWGIAVDSTGSIYIADQGNGRIRKISASGIITTVAGNGIKGFSGDGGLATSAELNGPAGVAVDSSGNLYIADTGNGRVRKVSNGVITTVAGDGDPNNTAALGLYCPSCIGDNGPATQAVLAGPYGLAVDSAGNLYIADPGTDRIRKVSNGIMTTAIGSGTVGFSGDGGPATSAELSAPMSVAVDLGGDVYFADFNNNRIRKVSNGVITTVAGSGPAGANLGGFSGDGGPATSARLNFPEGVAVDSTGNFYIADNDRIRKVSNGVITTVAGDGTEGFGGDGGLAPSAELNGPIGVAVDSGGSVYFADFNNNRIRLLTPSVFIAQPIPVFGTGQYATAGQDSSYQIVTDSTGEISAPAEASIVTSLAAGWTTIPGAAWIAPSPDQSNSTRANCCLSTSDHYRTTFSLAGLNPSTAELTVNLAADDYVDVLLNGQTVFTHPNTSMWSSSVSFVISSPFVAGTNTLDFLVSNAAGGPTGLIVSVAGTAEVSPYISPVGVVPIYSTTDTIQPGEWVSIYGSALASGTAIWNGNFPTSLGGTSVAIDGKLAYLWYVSPTQINLQAPNDTTTGTVPVVVTTARGSATSTVTLGQFAPSFSLLDTKHVAGIILRSDGTGAYGGGTYDIIGPTGNSLGYPTVAATAGDTVELYAMGLGPTNPAVLAGQPFSGQAPTTNQVNLLINNVSIIPTFSGLSSAGLYQINLTVPAGLGTGDIPLMATVGGVMTQSGVVISLQ